ncbi:beta-galactosidase [Herbiconiux sp. CPCC 205763]|uniref:Beta-galactosidase n=1 Tax=Herbiconiux aconitum TaxID=2970913 RepID=A0ABT2GLW3_9MICO|nr:beta-galactosidase [Herbiconiux aconitum]MCS5717209.1 beta-galactosidase [Herbiconiux aconitum]
MTDLISHAADLRGPTSFPPIADGFAFGGDYNPEQWPESVWADDVELMRRAGVTTATVGVFSWGLLERADGVFEWGWLDRVLDLLHENGIGVALATPTAAPPMWLMKAHPEIATVDENGVRTASGGRLAWSPSSAVFRRYALRMVRALAERYADHPALKLWHVSNELGNENAACYSDETEAAWQHWLAEKYSGIELVNEAWGTAFWGHRYGAFDEVQVPRFARTKHNPGLLLDFSRFSSDALLAHFQAERAVLREVTPTIPITTNFMVMGEPGADDYSRWAREVDIVANDHYLRRDDPHPAGDLAFSADRVRGMAGGAPWLLMEHSTGAVNWQGINLAKTPGQLARNSLAHIMRGADGALYFQWRQSSAGAEQYHSGMLPHAGADTRIFREVTEFGALLKRIAPAAGTTVQKARVAILFDDQSAWSLRATRGPSDRLHAVDLPKDFHRAFTARGIAVDVLPSSAPLDGYDVVLAPTLPLADDSVARALADAAERGAHVQVGFHSGVFDQSGRVLTGGYPGRFRELLGVRVTEVLPLLPEQSVATDAGWRGELWTEDLETPDADVVARYSEGVLAGVPVLTRRPVGAGSASYLATRPDEPGMGAIVDGLVALAALQPIAPIEPGLDVTRRIGDTGSFLFAINHDLENPRTVGASGVDLVSGRPADGAFTVAPGGVAVIREG